MRTSKLVLDFTEIALTLVAKIQPLFDSLHAFCKPIVSRMLVGDIAVEIGTISPKTSDSRLQARQPLLDLSHVILNRRNVGPNGSQMFKNQVFDVFRHGGLRAT
jgi:hypothetical protein